MEVLITALSLSRTEAAAERSKSRCMHCIDLAYSSFASLVMKQKHFCLSGLIKLTAVSQTRSWIQGLIERRTRKITKTTIDYAYTITLKLIISNKN